MSQATAMVTTGSREAVATAAGGKDETILSSGDHQDYRSVAGLRLYMSDVRHDIVCLSERSCGKPRVRRWSFCPKKSRESQDFLADNPQATSVSGGCIACLPSFGSCVFRIFLEREKLYHDQSCLWKRWPSDVRDGPILAKLVREGARSSKGLGSMASSCVSTLFVACRNSPRLAVVAISSALRMAASFSCAARSLVDSGAVGPAPVRQKDVRRCIPSRNLTVDPKPVAKRHGGLCAPVPHLAYLIARCHSFAVLKWTSPLISQPYNDFWRGARAANKPSPTLPPQPIQLVVALPHQTMHRSLVHAACRSARTENWTVTCARTSRPKFPRALDRVSGETVSNVWLVWKVCCGMAQLK